MKFDRLYKKNSSGSIQFWEIEATENLLGTAGLIITRYGVWGTTSPQETKDVISEGKNIGKANETTPYQQAVAEAGSKWEKQQKKGYVTTLDGAEEGQLSSLIEGGVVPMLAQSFAKHGHKIKYPCYVQPKLDGIRCIAILENRKCTLWSRTRKQITSCPHIVAEIEKHFIADIVLDGELYNHDFKANFEHIVHLVRQETPDDKCTDVQYHIYDTVNDKPFSKRTEKLFNCFTIGKPKFDYLVLVGTTYVESEDEIPEWFEKYTKAGYEGAMARNVESLYVNKRSYDLQKVKEFEDDEFEICGVEEGRGKLAGHVGAFVCKTSSGTQFLAKMSGDTGNLAMYFHDHSLWKGKKLTVKYQGLTGANKVPRFPVGIAIRDYE